MTFESEIHISHPNLDDKPEINNTEIQSTDKLIKQVFSFGLWSRKCEKNANFGFKLYFFGKNILKYTYPESGIDSFSSISVLFISVINGSKTDILRLNGVCK